MLCMMNVLKAQSVFEKREARRIDESTRVNFIFNKRKYAKRM